MFSQAFDDNSLSLFHLDNRSNISSALYGFDRSEYL